MLFTPEQLAGGVPVTGWSAPTTFPRLDAAKAISIDCETKDLNLRTKGPGEIRKDGHIVGLAVGTDDGKRWYFPMRHEFGGKNMNPQAVLAWARDELTRPHQVKIGANIMYDLSWLRAEGVNVRGKCVDVQFAEPLLDENQRRYSLEVLAQKHLGESKVDEALYQWLAETYGGKPTRDDQAANIYRAPASLVGPYAEGDVDLPMRIWQKQRPLLDQQELLPLFEIETDLIPMLLDMRWRGVRVDMDRAAEVIDIMRTKQAQAQKSLNKYAGMQVDVWANDSVARAFDKAGVSYNSTATGKPSFTKNWLENHPSDIAKHIVTVRKYDKASGTFVDGYIFNNAINGRVHTQFHPLKTDENGTVSGRFSSSNPNLQNLPSRDKELGPLIRSIFVPDEGHVRWRRYDYSQIEYRLLAHHAVGDGANDARQQFINDPNTDYHQMTRELIFAQTGIMLERKPTKNINFGLAYGMGVESLALFLGLTREEALPLFDAYHSGVPFVKQTYEAAQNAAKSRGFVRTILKRRRRFDWYEPRKWGDNRPALPREQALEEYGNAITRAGTHAALNSVLQGGSADMMKKAMRDMYKAGLCDVIGVPLITVHDELDHSDDGSSAANEAFEESRNIMETCVKLKIPVRADYECGPNWGQLEAA